jgi:hypothetical protein
MRFRPAWCERAGLSLALVAILAPSAPAQEKPASTSSEQASRAKQYPEHIVPLDPDGTVRIDTKRKRVILEGEACLREGYLELFACLSGTKEHESIVSVATQAQVVHAALVAVGADPGHPAQWNPEYRPAEGPEIRVTVFWTDQEGQRHRAKAQDWVRHLKSGEAMTYPWVFGGSGFWQDSTSGEERYLGEDGCLICVSNFSSAVMDLPIESSAQDAQVAFEAFTERIPPLGTQVTLVLTPLVPPAEAAEGAASR